MNTSIGSDGCVAFICWWVEEMVSSLDNASKVVWSGSCSPRCDPSCIALLFNDGDKLRSAGGAQVGSASCITFACWWVEEMVSSLVNTSEVVTSGSCSPRCYPSCIALLSNDGDKLRSTGRAQVDVTVSRCNSVSCRLLLV